MDYRLLELDSFHQYAPLLHVLPIDNTNFPLDVLQLLIASLLVTITTDDAHKPRVAWCGGRQCDGGRLSRTRAADE
jgi:hypothetical protein